MSAIAKQETGAEAMEGVRFDRQRFPDAMGWRCKFGVLTPAPNTIVENEFHEMAPPGVTNIVNRYYVPNQKIGQDEDGLMEQADHVLAGARVDRGLAADRGVDLGEKRRRDLDEARAALEQASREAGEIAHHAAAEGDDEIVALGAEFDKIAQHLVELGEGF